MLSEGKLYQAYVSLPQLNIEAKFSETLGNYSLKEHCSSSLTAVWKLVVMLRRDTAGAESQVRRACG